MSLVEGMRGRGVGVLGVHGGFVLEKHSVTMSDGLGGEVSARIAKVVRAGLGIVSGLVHG